MRRELSRLFYASDRMKKLFVPILVTTMLIVLPAVSWYYLQSGLTWRRATMNELKNLGSVKDVSLTQNGKQDYRFADFKTSSFVICKLNCTGNEELMRYQKLVDQFDERGDVHFIIMGDCTSNLRIENFKNTVLIADCKSDQNLCNQINESIFQTDNSGEIAFIDGDMNIRRFYNTNDLEEWQILVEHVSMMLPDERRQYGRENRN